MSFPQLVFLPALALDQTFPRTDDELEQAQLALASLNELSLQGKIVIGMTDEFIELVTAFDGTRFDNQHCRELYVLLVSMCAATHTGTLKLYAKAGNISHPIPMESLPVAGLVELWADEMGSLASVHEECGSNEIVCAGLASAHAFAGRQKTTYAQGDEQNLRFTLVGPDDYEKLPPCRGITAQGGGKVTVGVRDIIANYAAIGGVRIVDGGRHPAIEFENGHKWPYKKAWGTNIGDDMLKELVQITGYDLPVIKQALSTGEAPRDAWKPCVQKMLAA